MTATPYDIVVTPPARRAIENELPEPVAAAVVDFITTALLDNPRRVGKPLGADLAGLWSARRGTYRVIYGIRDDVHEVIVFRIDHRRDAYRPIA